MNDQQQTPVHLSPSIPAKPKTKKNVGRHIGRKCGFRGKTQAPIKKSRKKYVLTTKRVYWTEAEHERFLDALKKHGREWKTIERLVETKTAVQIRSHAQKYFLRLERQRAAARAASKPTMQRSAAPAVPTGVSPAPSMPPVHPHPQMHHQHPQYYQSYPQYSSAPYAMPPPTAHYIYHLPPAMPANHQSSPYFHPYYDCFSTAPRSMASPHMQPVPQHMACPCQECHAAIRYTAPSTTNTVFRSPPAPAQNPLIPVQNPPAPKPPVQKPAIQTPSVQKPAPPKQTKSSAAEPVYNPGKKVDNNAKQPPEHKGSFDILLSAVDSVTRGKSTTIPTGEFSPGRISMISSDSENDQEVPRLKGNHANLGANLSPIPSITTGADNVALKKQNNLGTDARWRQEKARTSPSNMFCAPATDQTVPHC